MTLIDTWDSGQPNAYWDVGLQWDVNLGPSVGDARPYLQLITSEHNQRPDFMTVVLTLIQPLADAIAVIESIPSLFDVDVAVGVQLDATGAWIGQSRELAVPLTGVYFSWDTENLGWEQGAWKGPFDPDNFLIQLPDSYYRLLLDAKIADNLWDGTIPGAYDVWAQLLEPYGLNVLIQDGENMTMIMALIGDSSGQAVLVALFTGGYLKLKPAGVSITYMTPSVPSVPYFGWDVENDSISGWDTGAWGLISSGD